MQFALKYRQPIDSITANKELKLRKYELDNDDWRIIEDLVAILEVRSLSSLHTGYANTSFLYSNIRKRRYFFPAIRQVLRQSFQRWTGFTIHLTLKQRWSIIPQSLLL